MISVIIEANHKNEALARTLTSLVGGAIDGLVAEVIICDCACDDQTRMIAEHMGCIYLENANASGGAAISRNEWLLFLEPGSLLLEGWVETAMLHIERTKTAARFSLSQHARQSFFSRILARRNPMKQGLLMLREHVNREVFCSAHDIAIKTGRTTMLNAGIMAAEN